MAQEGYPWGGSEPLWSSAAEKLVRQGNEVRVSVKDWGKPIPQIEHLRLAGCQIFIACHDFRADINHGEHLRTRNSMEQFLTRHGFTLASRPDDPRDYVRDHVFGFRAE